MKENRYNFQRNTMKSTKYKVQKTMVLNLGLSSSKYFVTNNINNWFI